MNEVENKLAKAVDLWNLIDPHKVTSARPMTEDDDLYMNYATMRIISDVLVVDMSKIDHMLDEIEAMKRGELPYHKTIFSYFGKIPPEFPDGDPSTRQRDNDVTGERE